MLSDFSANNRKALLQSTLCGCHFCRKPFPPSQIAEWTDEDLSGIGQTALCPRCGVDAVLGDAQPEPEVQTFMRCLKKAFGRSKARVNIVR